jgi:hypothetical protein
MMLEKIIILGTKFNLKNFLSRGMESFYSKDEEVQNCVTEHKKMLAFTRETKGMKAVKLLHPIGIHDKAAMPVNGSLRPPQKGRYPPC